MLVLDIARQSVDIGLMYIIYFVVAFVLLYFGELILGPARITIETPTILLVLELIIIFFTFGIVSNFIQLWIKHVLAPFKFYKHAQSTDFSEGTWVLIYTFLTCSVNIQNRLYVLYNRLMGTDYPLIYTTIQNRASMFRRTEPLEKESFTN